MKTHLPVLRLAEIDVGLLVEAALLGFNPVAMATLLGQHILELDREAAMEAERRRLPALRVHEVATEVYVDAAVLNLPITRREANILACYIVTESAARAKVRP